ncbi:hypothetical protein [Paenibacillus thalictri]|uniref:Uncharacterized protein n=1 Tax=Paenibacillus thalictri TaxID=2527873 RepID=A0A4Q9DDB8_9BACL|nr:hypothetical protein [Paenibacillus thalictri]TBL69088.1 hypothetical protein EYB31_36970 [Paenibacillus thalictri]
MKSDGQDTNKVEKPSRILTESADAIIIENYEESVERANREREAGDFPAITTEFPYSLPKRFILCRQMQDMVKEIQLNEFKNYYQPAPLRKVFLLKMWMSFLLKRS